MAHGYLRYTQIFANSSLSFSVGETQKQIPQSGFLYGMEAAAQIRR
jgi:hypothetical protein